MNFTKEQKSIIEYSGNKDIFVIAKAGTGKTTTLIEFTKQRPMESFLYVAYNRKIRNEAYKKFFGNTVVHTIHSLAWEHIGKYFEHKFSQNLKLMDIINGLPSLKKSFEKNKYDIEIYNVANNILNILSDFFNSNVENLDFYSSPYIDLVKEYWDLMQDLKSNVNMTQDGYLKLFQLSKPDLGYDYILIDEAQDSNAVMLDIIFSQKSQKIFVGDSYQSIYGYRNLINVFEEYKDNAEIFYLTKSFRFGETISFVVNSFMNYYKENYIPIVGSDINDMVGRFDYSTQYTFLTRTNAYLFELAYKASLQNKKIHIVGDTEEIFSEIIDTYYLYIGELYKIKNEYIKQYKTFNNFKKIADSTKNQDLVFLTKIIDKYNSSIFEMIQEISKNIVKERNADIVFSTVHKSKGLEFYNVRLANDFSSLFDKNGKLLKPNEVNFEEINIYYVAMTRAIENLEFNDELTYFFSII